jgi:dihydrofolate synthase / folylpolyglutamate synthase
VSDAPLLTSGCEAVLAPRLEQKILPGLDRILAVLDALGHPERAFPSALVLGTNGKGSTAALLASVLRHHTLRVGRYTSPHLVRVEERIEVDGETIPPGDLLAHLHALARFPQLSYFETLTAAALLHFAEARVEIAVLEAGLGGRWDATNVGEPSVALLTNVGTDHQAWLGSTRTEIAAEKAAALRGRDAIVGAWDAEVEPAIRAAADPATPLSLAADWASVTGERAPGATPAPPDPRAASPARTAQRIRFVVGGVVGDAALPLPGRHQVANLTLALAGAAALAKHGVVPPLRADAMTAGIAATRWPGRLHWLSWRGRDLLLDGAHNREAVRSLALFLDQTGLAGRVDLIFSCLADKPLGEMAAVLRPRVRRVLVAPLDSPRATPLGTLAAALPGSEACASVAATLDRLPGSGPVLVTGSLRLVGEVLRLTGPAAGA